MDVHTEAARRRKSLHRAIADRSIEAMRKALHDLYVDEASPLREMGNIKRVETYAPVVEATILAHAHARQTALCHEMRLNLLHTHAKFGIAEEDYGVIEAQLDRLDDDHVDARDVDWCAGTCLHGKVKPWRHERLFDAERGQEAPDPAPSSPPRGADA